MIFLQILIKTTLTTFSILLFFYLYKKQKQAIKENNNLKKINSNLKATAVLWKSVTKQTNNPLAIFSKNINKDNRLRYITFSKGWKKFFKLKEEEYDYFNIDKNLINLNTKWIKNIENVISTGKPLMNTNPEFIEIKEDNYWINWYMDAWFHENEINGIIVEIEDITERINLQIEYNSSLYLGQVFLSTTAHQIRSNCRNISLEIERLNDFSRIFEKQQTKENKKVHIYPYLSHTNKLIELSNNLINLCENLVYLGNISQIKIDDEPINLVTLIKEIIQSYNEETIFISHVENSILYIKGSRTLLKEVFSEILNNAKKYKHPDRKLKIEIELFYAKETQSSRVRIIDNGIGVQADKIDCLFKPYFRLNEHIEGSGLGLTFVKQVLLKHNATIKITSIPNVNFTIDIVFQKKF